MTMNTQLNARLQKIGEEASLSRRVLKDILVTLQWAAFTPENNSKINPDTVIRASSVYETGQIGNLLRSSQSVLSLALSGDVQDDTVSAVFLPDATSNIPTSDSITYTSSSGRKREVAVGSSIRTATIVDSIATLIDLRLHRRVEGSKIGKAIVRSAKVMDSLMLSGLSISTLISPTMNGYLLKVNPSAVYNVLMHLIQILTSANQMDDLQKGIEKLRRRSLRFDSICQPFLSDESVQAGISRVLEKLGRFVTATESFVSLSSTSSFVICFLASGIR